MTAPEMATPTANFLPTVPVSGSGLSFIDPLLGGSKWGATGAGTGVTLSYSVAPAGAVWSPDYAVFLENEPSQFTPLDPMQAAAFRQALQAWADVADIRFVEVAESASAVGEVRVGFSGVLSSTNAAAWAYLPGDYPEAGDIWLDPNYAENLAPDAGGFGYLTFMHEIGHALGLSHPFESTPALGGAYDNLQYTIMSYTDSPLYSNMGYPVTPMLYDIAAIQYLYGPNMSHKAGDDTHSFSSSTSTISTIWDAGGIDTLSAENQSLPATIDLHEGSYSSIGPDNSGKPAAANIAIAFNARIENARGGLGDDRLIGNDGANVLDGGPGADVLNGGLGDDTYIVDNRGDSIVEPKMGGGTDTVAAEVSFTLSKLLENLVLTGEANLDGAGNKLANSLVGNAGDNELNGGKGNDRLAGGLGSDTLIGSKGLDVFVFDTALGAGNVDTLSGFSARDDTIQLSLSVFDSLAGTGILSSSEFFIGSAAQDAGDRILYDSGSGGLYYDADGSGSGVAVQFAALGSGLALTAGDFLVA